MTVLIIFLIVVSIILLVAFDKDYISHTLFGIYFICKADFVSLPALLDCITILILSLFGLFLLPAV
jgi:hypothetical protein